MFGRALRTYAKTKGWTFSDHGLRRTVRSSEDKRIWKGTAFDCLTEADVFKKLGLRYIEPWDRSAKVSIQDLEQSTSNSSLPITT
jgi:DNA polymerase/3'-5' exonuclease PolX